VSTLVAYWDRVDTSLSLLSLDIRQVRMYIFVYWHSHRRHIPPSRWSRSHYAILELVYRIIQYPIP
jgi:hypothetical protein